MRFTPSPGFSALAQIWSEALVLATVAALAVLLADAIAPPQDLPWRPLRLADPPGLASAFKFERAAADPVRCRTVLTEGGLGFEEIGSDGQQLHAMGRELRHRCVVPLLRAGAGGALAAFRGPPRGRRQAGAGSAAGHACALP